jgi:hypothetical protein
MKDLSPERQKEYAARVKRVLDKEVPESYHYRCLYEAYFELYKTIAKAQLAFAESVFPLCDPTKHTASMKKIASKMLLMIAALGDVEKGRKIIHELKADVNYQDPNGNTPLSYAIRRKRLGMAEMLLENGADANKQNKQQLTPLLKACFLGVDKAIPVFARYQVDLNQKITFRKWNKFGLGWKTYHLYPLTYAITYGRTRVVSELLKHGANLDTQYVGKYSFRETLEKDKEFNLKLFTSDMHDIFRPYLMNGKQKTRE